MKGLVIGAALIVVALLLVGRGWTLHRQERERSKRLVAVRAQVTDQGSQPIVSVFRQSDGTERQDVSYEGRYEYVAAGTRHAGRVTSVVPVFRSDQMPPAEITVFYDSAEPSVSRTSRGPGDAGRAHLLFGAVVFAVAVAVVGVANLPSLLRR